MADINRREIAHRLFAAEFNASRFEIKGSADERSPGYVISPLGAKVNRILVVGVLTELENISQEGELWRARISDPTGVFTVYAGRYQPEAAKALGALQPPQYVAIVGKMRTYEPEPGRIFVSVRPESIQVVDESVRNHWVFETARQTAARVEAVRSALTLDKPAAASLSKLAVPAHLIEGLLLSLEKYAGDVDLEYFDRVVTDALSSLIEGQGFAPPAPAAAPLVSVKPKPKGPGEEVEQQVLAIIEGLATGDDKGAQWDLIVSRGEKAGVTEDRVEEALNSLMDKGLIYEPILGRLKMT